MGAAPADVRPNAVPAIVGRSVMIDREPHQVVGVAPAEVGFPEGAQLWRPMEYDGTFRTLSRGAWYLTVIGRLAPGVQVQAAREEVGAIARRLEQQYREQPKDSRVPEGLRHRRREHTQWSLDFKRLPTRHCFRIFRGSAQPIPKPWPLKPTAQ